MKILSAETNLGSATNVWNASVIRLFNSGDSNILVTKKDYAGTVVGSFMVPNGEVVYAEKYYTDTLEGSADVKATKVAYSSMMSFVGSSSSGPTYTVSVSASAVDEGGSFTTTLTTTNVDDGTSFNYILSGTNIAPADFSSGSLTGSVTISNNTGSFSHTLSEDATTEGTETVTIRLIDSSLNYVGNAITVTINDTSTTPVYGYSTSFDGNDDYLYVGGNATREAMADFGTGAYTIECWLRTTKALGWIFYNADNNSGVRICFGNNAGGSGNAGGKIEINEQSANNDEQTRTSATYNDGQWHHVAFCRPDGGQVKVFVDGDLKVTGSSSGRNLSATAVTPFLVGRRGSGGSWFEGEIFGLRVIKGQAIYTGTSLTVPTSVLTTTSQGATASNVTLLACQTNDPTTAEVSPESANTLQAYGVTSSSDDPL